MRIEAITNALLFVLLAVGGVLSWRVFWWLFVASVIERWRLPQAGKGEMNAQFLDLLLVLVYLIVGTIALHGALG